MTAIATGSLGGRTVTLRFEDGVISGDEIAVRKVRDAIRSKVDVCIAGVTGGEASLEDDFMALATFFEVLDDASGETDDEPLPIPEGADV